MRIRVLSSVLTLRLGLVCACGLLFAGFYLTPKLELQKLPGFINTVYDETNPIVSEDGKTLYFTRVGHPGFDKSLIVDGGDLLDVPYREYRRELQEMFSALGSSNLQSPHHSEFNQDVWIAHADGTDFTTIEHPKHPLNNALPNSVCAITKTSDKVVVINQFYEDGSMYKGFSFVSRDGDDWTFPKPLYIYDYESLDPGVNLSLSRDNEVMVLSIENAYSMGEQDLFVSFRIHQTLWSAPRHMGSVINSSARDITPFISDDKRFVLFASARDGRNTDIYKSDRLDDSWTNWSLPQRLESPVNSSSDDAQPFLNRRTGLLYFSSTRDGSSDIFRVKFAAPKAPRVLARRANRSIRCYVVNSQTGEAIEANVTYSDSSRQNRKTVKTSPRGFLMEFDSPLKWYFQGEKSQFFAREIVVDPGAILASKLPEPQVEIALDPIAAGTKISLAPIYFMRGKDRILSPSYGELDRLVDLLRHHNRIEIEIGGHTDNVGDQYSLFQLSQNRSRAIKRYLVKSGIQAHRIKTKGYGPSRPLTDNSNESLRARNRRVEVTIIKVS
ncbi:MAG: OmpA family protein [Saprospiraceae bacterium]|nr:OmpA family protein [Saprospiraceae bacterium]